MDKYTLPVESVFRTSVLNRSNNNGNNNNSSIINNNNNNNNSEVNMHQTNQLHHSCHQHHPYTDYSYQQQQQQHHHQHNSQQKTQHHQHHHHKDHMLAAGSTPTTTEFHLYETSHNKSDIVLTKNDYPTYINCSQQSVALLDPITNNDVNINTNTNTDVNLVATESMASLSSLCNLKFSNSGSTNGEGPTVDHTTSNRNNMEQINADTSNFKNLSLLPIIEANTEPLLSDGKVNGSSCNSANGNGSVRINGNIVNSINDSSGDSLNKSGDICGNIVEQIAKLSQLKSNSNTLNKEIRTEFLKSNNYNVAAIKPDIRSTTATVTTTATIYRSGETIKHPINVQCTELTAETSPQFSDIMMTDNCNTQLLDFATTTAVTDNTLTTINVMKTTETVTANAANRFSMPNATGTLKNSDNTANNNSNNNGNHNKNNINGNIIAITTINNIEQSSSAANDINDHHTLYPEHDPQQPHSHNNLTCNLHSIKDVGAQKNILSNCTNSCTTNKETISPIRTNNPISSNAISATIVTNTITTGSSTIPMTSLSKKCHSQLQHSEHIQIIEKNFNDSDSDDNSSSDEEFLVSDLTDTISEFVTDEEPIVSGYQDTTSSHSQHSSNNGGVGGGGGGGGNGNGNGNGSASGQTNLTIPNSVAGPGNGVSLINGVVTLNSQISGNGGGGGGGSGPPGGITANSINSSNNGSSSSSSYMSLLPPAIGATSSSGPHLTTVNALGGTSALTTATTADVIDIKQLFEELCPVCGDKVSGYHYGLLTCESCKGFFKRTVQNKKVYTCVAERSCHIDKTQRKRCPYCRFQKCLDVGMKLEAVRADRMRGGRNKFGPMYKRDRARKLQVMRQRQIALQALRTMSTSDMKSTPLSPTGYQQAYTNMNIKQEIQIPQVSSLTQSPDSSPSPIAIALGQVQNTGGVIATPINGNSGNASNGGGGNGNNSGGGGGGGGGGGNSGGGVGINNIGSNGNSNNHNQNNSNNNNSDGINRVGNTGSGNSCHESSTGVSLQNASDSKLCFDSSTHPSSTADSIIEPPLRVSPMIREFVQSIDDREWQTQLFALLQKQTYNQVEVDLFELMCKVLDQNLFSQVDWARNTVFFKDLKVDDQMKLLQHSWSDMLVLDHLHQRIHNGLPDETQLNNGQIFNLLNLGLLGVTALADYFNEIQSKLQDLKFDMGDYVCMKFLILLNPDVHGIINKKAVLRGYQNVQGALLDYNLTCYQSVTDKFQKLLNILPEIHALATRGEEHLYTKHCAGSAPTQTLLMEMLHAKRKV